MLKEIRKGKKITQDELARLTGINKMQISRIERGEIKIGNISLTNALKIADALDVDVRRLLADPEEKAV